MAVEPTSARPPRPRPEPAAGSAASAAEAPVAAPAIVGTVRAGRRARALVRILEHRLAWVRAVLRADEVAFVGVAALVGAFAGVAVAIMSRITQWLHEILFGLGPGVRLSASHDVTAWRMLLVPVAGGLVLGTVMSLSGRYRSRQVVDPIEANALYGGRMSLLDSLGVGLETLISNGAGASIGLEAGYTQVGSGGGSWLGERLRLRRNDLRMLVSCGAAGAIGGAFDAPLTGAFYAFELVLGGYTPAALTPVLGSALAGTAAAQLLAAHSTSVEIATSAVPGWRDNLLFLLLGFLAALAAIGLMLGVTQTERFFRGIRMPRALRPALGGVIVGLLGLLHPEVLSAGHGALHALLDQPFPLQDLAVILVAKVAASAVSIGSGFRGGLFFASLFMGALLGATFAAALPLIAPELHPDPHACAIVGMGAMAVAVVGGPLTMVFLALETTGDFALTPSLTAAVVVAALTARRTFGYSFATWRFHLRGEAIRSAHDVGWIRNLTVGRLMRRDARTVRSDMLLTAFRRQFPLGSATRVVGLDEAERYAGIVLLADAHAPARDEKAGETRIEALLRYRNAVLLPSMNVKEAAAMFERAEADALAVVDHPEARRVLGLLTEAHTLRRYAEELDRRRRELSGEG